MYSEPKNTSKKLGYVDAGTKIEIVKKNYTSTWHQVWYKDKLAYVWTGNFNKPKIVATESVTQTANVYSQAKNTSTKLGSISKGAKVEIVKKNYTSTWHQVWYNGKIGYVWTGNFTGTINKPKIVATESVIQTANVYSQAKNTSTKLGSIRCV